jgi:hypothetical protein
MDCHLPIKRSDRVSLQRLAVAVQLDTRQCTYRTWLAAALQRPTKDGLETNKGFARACV